jgi:hypothetical protein
MPRKNDKHVPRDGGRRRGGPRGRNPVQAVSVHRLNELVEKDAAERAAERESSRPWYDRPKSAPAAPKVSTESARIEPIFARRLFFGATAGRLLRIPGGPGGFSMRVFQNVDPLGHMDVEFTGARSQRPDAKIAFDGLRAYVNPHNIVVVSGKVSGEDLDEIGHGKSGRIRQVESPTPDPDLTAPKWLHIALGTRPDGYDTAALSNALRTDGPLELTPVFLINGRLSFPGDHEGREEAWRLAPPARP